MSETFFVIPVAQHQQLVESVYLSRGFSAEESHWAAHYASMATWHGNRTHNAIKALHLDELFGSAAGGCLPQATIERLPSRFPGSQVWNANKKLGQPTAHEAINEAIRLAERYGIGQVSVDYAFHYLWGGGYVMQAAKAGYIAYTHCTASLAEVVPYQGKTPKLGTNPHSWGFPTESTLGFPIVVDWATSVVAMGRVQQLKREGSLLPPDAAVDQQGNYTTDPAQAAALTTFGGHKGYGLSLINELVAAYIGGSLPSIRSRWGRETKDKQTPCFYFQVIHPEAISGGAFSQGGNQLDNVQRVIDDILTDGNEHCLLPGQPEFLAAERSAKNQGLLFTAAEIEALNEYARQSGAATLSLNQVAEL
jgi:ureidoglycolate dehydrogenase (NAD+)